MTAADLLPIASVTLLLATVLAAAAIDVRTGRIPNALTAPAVLAGLVLATLAQGLGGLGSALGGAALALVIGGTLFALGGMGGGDAKLLVVVGAFLGPAHFLHAGAFIAIAGGVMAFAVVAQRRILRRPALASPGAIRYVATAEKPLTVPYGVAIAAGTLLSVLIRGGAL